MSEAVSSPAGRPPALGEVEQFLYREARLLDVLDYDAWEALWTDDAIYWVPGESDGDPATRMSVIYDNRSRIATRIKQLKTGKRHAQTPPSHVSHLVTGVEILETRAEEVTVAAACLVAEGREEGTHLWAGRTTHRLRVVDGQLRMALKKVVLVDRAWALPTMAFII